MRLLSVLLVVGLLAGFGCSSPSGDDSGGGNGGNGGNGGGGGNGGSEEPVSYTLTASVNPSQGGSVDPSSGTYDEGEEVTVTATAANGWTFTGWSGDATSSDNPLTFTINQDTDLTASFEEDLNSYSNQLEVSDGTYSETLTFGMKSSASNGYDSNMEDEAPPAPPSGSFYANFVISRYNLYDDFRPVQSQKTVWELNFSPSSSNDITISWDFSSSNHHGSLSLVDDVDNPSININMDSESSYNGSNSVEVLYIIQQ